MRWTAVLLWLAACGGSHGLDGGMSDGGGSDAFDAMVSGRCTPSPIASADPIALVFSGSALATDYSGRPVGTIEETLVVYFPEGTADGARAITAHPVSWPYPGLITSEATIAGGIVSVAAGGSFGGDFSVSGTLELAQGIVIGMASRNFASPSTDVAEPGMGPIELCARGEATESSAIRWVGTPAVVSPLSTLHFAPSVPLDTSRASLVHEGRAVPLEVTASMGSADLRPTAAWPMGESMLVFDGVDILGDAPALPPAINVARPTATLSDLSLDTAPPEGAVNGEWRDGALRAGLDGFGAAFYLSTELTAGLGTPPPSATSVRVTFVRSVFGYLMPRAAVVTEAGEMTAIDLGETTGPDPLERVVPIPGPGPLYLVVAVDVVPPRPQWLPAYGRGGVDVTEIAFE